MYSSIESTGMCLCELLVYYHSTPGSSNNNHKNNSNVYVQTVHIHMHDVSIRGVHTVCVCTCAYSASVEGVACTSNRCVSGFGCKG